MKKSWPRTARHSFGAITVSAVGAGRAFTIINTIIFATLLILSRPAEAASFDVTCAELFGATSVSTVRPERAITEKKILATDEDVAVHSLRAEILAANLRDQASGRDGATISNFIEDRAADIKTPAPGYDVVSLGSGPDIFLPLYLHPFARALHLVDGLGGWGHGPEQIIEEIETRLHALAPDAEVQRLDDQGDWRKIEGFLRGPLIWRVRWTSPSQGLIEKTVSLHQVDFNNLERLNELKLKNLGGVVITGITPSWDTHHYMVSLLIPDGSLFTELYPASTRLNKKLLRTYAHADYGEQRLPGMGFVPRAYEFRPKHKK